MIEFHLSDTEVEILLRALKLARESKAFPDPAMRGDQVRVDALEQQQQLRQNLDEHHAGTWADRMKSQTDKSRFHFD